MGAKQLFSDNALLTALDVMLIKATLDEAPLGAAWSAFGVADQQNGTKSSYLLQKATVLVRAQHAALLRPAQRECRQAI